MAIPPTEGNLDGGVEGVECCSCWDGKRAADARISDVKKIDLEEVVGQILGNAFLLRHRQGASEVARKRSKFRPCMTRSILGRVVCRIGLDSCF